MTSKARRTLAVAAAVFLLAAPSAPAMPMDSQTSRPAHVGSGMEYGDLRVSEPTVEPAPPSAPSGFDWTAAGIGALAASGLAAAFWTALHVRRPVGRRVAA
jgi:hypothetical protein